MRSYIEPNPPFLAAAGIWKERRPAQTVADLGTARFVLEKQGVTLGVNLRVVMTHILAAVAVGGTARGWMSNPSRCIRQIRVIDQRTDTVLRRISGRAAYVLASILLRQPPERIGTTTGAIAAPATVVTTINIPLWFAGENFDPHALGALFTATTSDIVIEVDCGVFEDLQFGGTYTATSTFQVSVAQQMITDTSRPDPKGYHYHVHTGQDITAGIAAATELDIPLQARRRHTGILLLTSGTANDVESDLVLDRITVERAGSKEDLQVQAAQIRAAMLSLYELPLAPAVGETWAGAYFYEYGKRSKRLPANYSSSLDGELYNEITLRPLFAAAGVLPVNPRLEIVQMNIKQSN